MAIKAPLFKLRGGVTITSPYLRIEAITGGKHSGQWQGTVRVYASDEAANPKKIKIGQRKKLDAKGTEILDEDKNFVMEDVFTQPAPESAHEFGVRADWSKDAVPEQLLYSALKAMPEMSGATDV